MLSQTLKDKDKNREGKKVGETERERGRGYYYVLRTIFTNHIEYVKAN